MMAPTNIIKKDRKRIIVLRFSDFQCCCTYIPKYLVGQFPIEKGLLCKWLIEDLLCSRLAWNLIYEKAPGRGLESTCKLLVGTQEPIIQSCDGNDGVVVV